MAPESNPPLDQLLPWHQVAALHRRPWQVCVNRAAPRLQLRGDSRYLRALRAAEMTAWNHAAGAPNHTFIPRRSNQPKQT